MGTVADSVRTAAKSSASASAALGESGRRSVWRVAWAWLRGDPRRGQILCLSTLFAAGIFLLDFGLPFWLPVVTVATALGVQALAGRFVGVPFDPLSPIITALSLSFLLRTEAPWISAAAAAIAIGSKFVLHYRGRHVFNPANLALVLATLSLDGAWISPGQWGTLGLLAILLAGAGAAVAGSAARLDTSVAFLGTWGALTFGRAFWLGDPIAIPLHQLQSGALLIFAFFMISDPATTPPRRAERVVHAATVAGFGFWLQTAWISETGAILALVLLALPTALLTTRRPAVRAPFHRKETRPCPAASPLDGGPASPVAAPAPRAG